MTGTSLDGLDCALVQIDGRGLEMHATLVTHANIPLGELSNRLRSLAQGQPASAGDFANLARDMGLAHLHALQEWVVKHPIDLVALHGQTVFHQPPLSWQLINPWPIALALKVPTIFDLRGADLAAAGQGAPITPLADLVLFRSTKEHRVILNLGGFANYTRLLAAATIHDIAAGDLCVCNQLLDSIAQHGWSAPYDDRGQHARHGKRIAPLFDKLVSKLGAQASQRRSLGSGDVLVENIPTLGNPYHWNDVAHTACAAIAHVIAQSIGKCDQLILAGGGVKNHALTDQIREQVRGQVILSDDLGMPTQAREAAEIAVLGALCQDRVPITLPQVTRCQNQAPIAGCWIFP